MTMSEVIEIIDQVDENKDGKLDYDEFSKLILSNVEECKRVAKERVHRRDFGHVDANKNRGPVQFGSQRSPPQAARTQQINKNWHKFLRRATFHLDEAENGTKYVMVQTYDIRVKRRTKLVITMAPLKGIKLLDCKADLGLLLLQVGGQFFREHTLHAHCSNTKTICFFVE